VSRDHARLIEAWNFPRAVIVWRDLVKLSVRFCLLRILDTDTLCLCWGLDIWVLIFTPYLFLHAVEIFPRPVVQLVLVQVTWRVCIWHPEDSAILSMRYIVVRYIVVRYIVVRYIVVRYIVVRYIVVRYIVVRYIVVRYIVVRYIVVRYIVVRFSGNINVTCWGNAPEIWVCRNKFLVNAIGVSGITRILPKPISYLFCEKLIQFRFGTMSTVSQVPL
jgi:hypothetical protein